MAELVADCPRCGAKNITFDLTQEHKVGVEHGWQYWYEAFCICRHCKRSTIYVLSQKAGVDTDIVHRHGVLQLASAVNRFLNIDHFISRKDAASVRPPEHLPRNIRAAFEEGAKCLAVSCPNAAATMFRLCIDLATRGMLPDKGEEGPNSKIRNTLGLRLAWLFDSGRLPEALRELSSCVREDGNDGAHEGTLSVEDAEDLLDFAVALLERLYTEPERLRLAKARREGRRAKSSQRAKS